MRVLKQVNSFGFSIASSGAHFARSMMFLEMRTLVRSMPLAVTQDDFTRAIVEENVLEKPTQGSRSKSLHHLIELYSLDPSRALFRVLWQLGHSDPDSLPQLCLICAYARDAQLRHSFELIRTLRLGEVLERASMEQHLEFGFPGRFSPAMKKSMAQNVNTTWTFGGLLMRLGYLLTGWPLSFDETRQAGPGNHHPLRGLNNLPHSVTHFYARRQRILRRGQGLWVNPPTTQNRSWDCACN